MVSKVYIIALLCSPPATFQYCKVHETGNIYEKNSNPSMFHFKINFSRVSKASLFSYTGSPLSPNQVSQNVALTYVVLQFVSFTFDLTSACTYEHLRKHGNQNLQEWAHEATISEHSPRDHNV